MNRTTRFLLAVMIGSVIMVIVANMLFPGHPRWKIWRGTSLIPWAFAAINVAVALWFTRRGD